MHKASKLIRSAVDYSQKTKHCLPMLKPNSDTFSLKFPPMKAFSV